MTISLPFSLYDCFSSAPFGGSQAAIVEPGEELTEAALLQIARETGMPVTVFVSSVAELDVHARFFSTVMEQPMCGHGTIGLFTHLLATHRLLPQRRDTQGAFMLHMPNTSARVESHDGERRQPLIMLDVWSPSFEPPALDVRRVCSLWNGAPDMLHPKLPVEIANADFVHLILPSRGLPEACACRPDFAALTEFCLASGLETICVLSLETARTDTDVHVRDFCPAVGVTESSSAGTTNAVVAAYLLRHGVVGWQGRHRLQIYANCVFPEIWRARFRGKRCRSCC